MPPIYHQELKQIKNQAAQLALKLGQLFITPEHLLLTLLESECQAKPFISKHFAVTGVKKELNAYLKSFKSEGDEIIAALPEALLSLRSSRTMREAEELASSFKEPVNSLHLLWALLQEHRCFAVETLVRLNWLKGKHGEDSASFDLNDECDHICGKWCTEIEALLVSSGSHRLAIMSLTSEKRGNNSKYWRKQLTAASQMLLNNQVIQGSAVERVANTLTRSWANVMGTDRPMASFLFVGPRGSGKRSLARNIASFLFNSPDRLNSISLGDFSEELRVSQLLQSQESPEKDSSQEGALTKVATEYPYSLIYLEDVERANSKTMDIIHRLLKHGHILDSQGKIVDFRGNVIILSLSIDPVFFEREKVVGLRSNAIGNSGTQESYERLLMEDLERVLRADTLGLVDEVVFFPPLTDQELTERAKILAKELCDNVLRQYNIELKLDDSVYAYLMKRLRDLGKDTGTLRRIFTREVSNAVAQALLDNRLKAGKKALLKGPENGDKNAEGKAITVEALA
ncbi:AAA family ATPase [bacterium]|nr:AAA family ATPase [bacterium]